MRSLRAENPLDQVAFGYRTVSLVDANALADAQLGYAVDPEGRNLTGRSEGPGPRRALPMI